MTKPFEFADLVQKLKTSGLPILENQAEAVCSSMFAWLSESAAHPDSHPIVKLAVPLAVQAVKPVIDEQINKIDGQPG